MKTTKTKRTRMNFFKLAVFAAMMPTVLFSTEFLSEAKWNAKAPAVLEIKDENSKEILSFQLPKTETPIKFVNFYGSFSVPVDLSKMEKVTLKLSGNIAIPIGLSFFCAGGFYQTTWSKSKIGKEETVIEFTRDAFSDYKKPDLTQAKQLIVNLGIWACNSTERDMEIKITSIEIIPVSATLRK